MRVDNSTGKGTSGMVKFSSKVHRVHMELGGKLLDSLKIKTQFLERLQSVSVVDGATHIHKDDMERNGGFLENVAEIFLLFLYAMPLLFLLSDISLGQCALRGRMVQAGFNTPYTFEGKGSNFLTRKNEVQRTNHLHSAVHTPKHTLPVRDLTSLGYMR